MGTKYYSVEIIWSEEDDAFLARCPELGTSFIAHGDTRTETLSALEAALKLILETLKTDGQSIPEPRIIEYGDKL